MDPGQCSGLRAGNPSLVGGHIVGIKNYGRFRLEQVPGAGERTRTPNPLITIQPLYR